MDDRQQPCILNVKKHKYFANHIFGHLIMSLVDYTIPAT